MTTTRIATKDLTGPALDWAVAKAEGFDAKAYEVQRLARLHRRDDAQPRPFTPSTDWAQGGPIIEREGLAPQAELDGDCKIIGWDCQNWRGDGQWIDGPTYLIAAMRCYVASKLGEFVDVPTELLA